MLGFPPGACTKNRLNDLLLEGRKGCLVTIYMRSSGVELKAASRILPEIDNVHDLRGRFGSREILDPDRMDIVSVRLPRNNLRHDRTDPRGLSGSWGVAGFVQATVHARNVENIALQRNFHRTV